MSFVEVLRSQGGALAAAVAEDPPGAAESGPAQLAALGPRCAAAPAEYELLLEMILEGARLHYGPQRVVKTGDHDLALLLGDQLYAMGLVRIAAIGDHTAVAELADLISLLAQASAAEDPELVDAVWHAGAVAIGWGPSPALIEAKAMARAGHPQAASALLGAAEARRA